MHNFVLIFEFYNTVQYIRKRIGVGALATSFLFPAARTGTGPQN
jgi:hypothetical protein